MIKLWFSERASTFYPDIITFDYEKNEGLIEQNKNLRYSLNPPCSLKGLYQDLINDLVINSKNYVSFQDKHINELKAILKENNIIVIIE